MSPSFLGLGAAKNAGSLSIMTLSLGGKFVWFVVWCGENKKSR